MTARRGLGNPDKVAEIAGDPRVTDVDAGAPTDVPDVDEDGDTLRGERPAQGRALGRGHGQLAVADDSGIEVDALGGAPGVSLGPLAGGGRLIADNVRQACSPARAASAAPGAPLVGAVGRCVVARRPRGGRRGTVEGTIADGPAGRRRLRLRPGVRARRGRRSHVRRDDRGREARHQPPGPRPPGPRRRARARRLQPATSRGGRPARSTTSSSVRCTQSALVLRRRSGRRGPAHAGRGRRRWTATPSCRAKIVCSSEQYHTVAAVDGRVAVVHAQRLEPAVGRGPARRPVHRDDGGPARPAPWRSRRPCARVLACPSGCSCRPGAR